MRTMRYVLSTLVGFAFCAGGAEQAADLPIHVKGAADELCENALVHEGMCDLAWAFSALWLDRDVAEANVRLRSAYDAFLDGATAMTPEIADQKAKWQMRTWIRVYYLFNDQSAWFSQRLEPDTQRRIETLFWNYACAKSTLERARPEYVWLIQGSENHDMMDLGNAFLAAQAIAKQDDYRERVLPDGHTLSEHAAAWTRYYTLYCEERVKRGLFIEVASPTYGKYLIPELVNLYDFAEDPALRHKVEVLLHTTWADWAVEQLDGVRGGGKARCYQGNYSRNGGSDSWRMMGQVLLGEDDWPNARRYAHPIMGFGFILATSRYHLPALVADMALGPEGRGEYVYVSRRPGRMSAPGTLPPLAGHSCRYFMDRDDSRLVRYTWCTPDHIMGSFLVDPFLTESTTVAPGGIEEARRQYAAISGQNRWQGIVFATGVDARIFPQCIGRPDKKKPDLSVTEIQHVAVQHRNVLIVQTNRAEPRNTAMRVYFAPKMRQRLVREAGWHFLEEGDSYAAVKALSREDGSETCETSWGNDRFLRVSDPYAPVVFVTGRRARHASLVEFQEYVLEHTHEVQDGVLRYRFEDPGGETAELTLWVNEAHLPEVNGIPIDLAPRFAYDCPFLSSEFGSGVVAVTFGGRELKLDVDLGH